MVCVPAAQMKTGALDSGIGHEFHERSIGIAEVNTGAGALGAEALHRTALDSDAATLQMRDGIGNRPHPFEAQIAVAWCDRQPRYLGRLHAWPVHVELLVTEAVGIAYRPRHELGSEHRGVERIGAFPFGDVDHAMIELRGRHCSTPSPATTGRARAPMSASSRSRVCRRASCRALAPVRPWRGLSR